MHFLTEYRNVRRLLETQCPVLIYAESRYYYSYLQPLIHHILGNTSPGVFYITSDKKDELLVSSPEGLQVIYVNALLGFLFPRLRAETMIMTMPDIDNFLYRRSTQVKDYIYVFHAAVSIHQQYNKEAFFHYDTIFCAGPYHEREIRAAELLYNLPVKRVIRYGYPLFDIIKKEFDHQRISKINIPYKKILIAPSWYESCIFETCIEELIGSLTSLEFKVYVRPHPEFVKRRKKGWKRLQNLIRQSSNVKIDDNVDVIDSLIEADFLITDRSGIAFEFAFGTYRPVLFIDTPPKIMNKQWKDLLIEPIEDVIRNEMGIRVSPTEIHSVVENLKSLESLRGMYSVRLQEMKKELFFDSEKGMAEALAHILGI